MFLTKRGVVILLALAAAILGTSMIFTSTVTPYRLKLTPNRADVSETRNARDITDRVFLLLKTGAEVAYDRMPAHVSTTLKRFPSNRVYADVDYTISGVQMVDSLSFLDEEVLNSYHLLGYRLRRQSDSQGWNWGTKNILIEGENSGWALDRFKNLPAFAHAWTQDPSKDWYVMIDADSYIFAHTLEFVTSKYNPNDTIYLGKAVGGEPFAHGGSGIVLSRGAMLAIFGTTHEELWNRLLNANRKAEWNCCGDEVVAQVFTEVTGLHSGTYLDHSELTQFQGGQIPTVHLPTDERWCSAAPTFHELTAWEIYKLNKWEEYCDKAGLNQTYGQYYHDFIKQQVVSELPNWVFHDGNWDGGDEAIDVRKYQIETPEAHDKHLCISKCTESPDCMMWTYLGDEICKNFHGTVSTGSRMNAHNPKWKDWPEVASGYMVNRIKQFRNTQPCDRISQDWAERLYKERIPETVQHRDELSEGELQSENYKEATSEGWLIAELSGEFNAEGPWLTSHQITSEV